VPGLKAGRFRLDKHIPAAAGIGGGSADAAAALRLLARVNGFSLDDARLMTAALHAGADVPVCLEQRTCIMTGVGERLSPPLHLPKLQAVLVNPGLPLATRDVFAAFKEMKSRPSPLSAVPRQPMALIEFLKAHGNDLTEAAIACAPVVGDVLKTLTGLPGAQLVRMSGSGPTCFAIFVSGTKAVTAAQILKTAHADWWVQPTGIG
jgi:4-diphosphocytidyl-2-C-methyl-D-erythritol kinase